MSNTTRNMQGAPLRPGPTPIDTDPPTGKDGLKPKAASEEPAVSIEGGLAKNMLNTLGDIHDVLRGSTIAEERGKDVDSKFWAAYKKVSNEYDDDFLERANDDMGIILTFAGLFSAVNSTFIIGMQPNPGDTTNDLLLHLIKITAYGPSAVPDISSLSSFTGYPSSIVWMRTLACASLAFSVLAAFGAVMGKQWLNSYKAARGRGSLEERGMRRQMKLDGLEDFRLQAVLQGFLVLLQVSLLFFSLSLCANMWTQQTTISSVLICTTSFGILFYAGTVCMSAWRPDSPFQSPGSVFFGALYKRIFSVIWTSAPDTSNIHQEQKPTMRPEAIRNNLSNSRRRRGRHPSSRAEAISKEFLSVTSTLAPNVYIKSSAVRWILQTSTNPEVVEAAAAMVPLVQWPSNLDASAAYARLRDNSVAYHDSEELFAKCSKAMAHLCIQSVTINPGLRWKNRDTRNCWGGNSRFIHDAFMAGGDAWNQLQNTQQADAIKHRANARTALRTIVVHGLEDELSLPDNEALIWAGDLCWRHSNGRAPVSEDFDWVIDYLEGSAPTAPIDTADDQTDGDALLSLSAMHGLGSTAKRPSYIRSLIRCMGPTRPPRVRHAALRALHDARSDLASITSDSMPQGVDPQLLDELSRALLTAVLPNRDQAIHDSEPDSFFHDDRDLRYIHIISALTQHDEWCHRLTRDGHFERCISLVDEVCEREWEARHYLPVIFGRMHLSGKVFPFSLTQQKWRELIRDTWLWTSSDTWDDGYADTILALMATTRRNWPDSNIDVPRVWLEDFAEKVDRVLAGLQRRQAAPVNESVLQTTVDTAISSVRCLYDDLSHMIEHPDTS